jgi:hypothetical protein
MATSTEAAAGKGGRDSAIEPRAWEQNQSVELPGSFASWHDPQTCLPLLLCLLDALSISEWIFSLKAKDFERFLEGDLCEPPRQATKAQPIEAGQNEGDQVTET